MTLTVIGIDPGPTTGIVELMWDDTRLYPLSIVQCNAHAVTSIVEWMVNVHSAMPVYLAVEKFVDGRRSGRGNSPGAGRTTRDMVAYLTDRYQGLSYVFMVLRSASEVKPWATDERLHRVGLWTPTKGMTHARDAARHALFAVVQLGVPDPMSTRAKAVSNG